MISVTSRVIRRFACLVAVLCLGVANSLLLDNDQLYAAFTTVSFWQAYNKTISAPLSGNELRTGGLFLGEAPKRRRFVNRNSVSWLQA